MSNASSLLNSSFSELRLALDNASISSRELTFECLRRARASQSELNAFITILDEEALASADAADLRLKAGERNPLLGLPVAIKDLILTKGHLTTAASKMLETFVAPYDATVWARLKLAGCPLVGKSNLDEFAMGSSNETSHFGAVRNPWNLGCVPGGSSGGSAAVVAARVAPLSLGTDTGGSIRQPSSFCGLTGLKPTYGRVSRYGVVAFASSLDQVGPMAPDALSCAALLATISGHDHHDATSSSAPPADFLAETKAWVASCAEGSSGLRGKRIGIPKEYFSLEGLNEEVRKSVLDALNFYRGLGAELVELSLPHTRYAVSTYYLVCTAEASSNLARYDGVHYGHRSPNFKGGSVSDLYIMTRGEGFGDEVRLRILLGTFALSAGYYDAYFKKASQVRTLIKRDFEEAFQRCDFVAGPTAPTTAFKLGEKQGDPLAMYLSDVYTLSTNLAGLPGISFNVGFDSKNLPIGLQLVSPWWKESSLLGMAAIFQNLRPESQKISPLAQGWSAHG